MTIPLLNAIDRDPSVIDRLTDRQIEEFAPAFTPRWNKYMPLSHTPTAKQLAFLLAPEIEVGYGGAAGGGKSDGLLLAGLQYVDVPGYAALLLRKTYADLERPGALIQRSHEWLRGTDAHWNGRRWTFPSGAQLDFGHLEADNDKYEYQSSQYQFIGMDELTQWQTDEPYRYLFSRLRRLVGSIIPIRMRSATNPGGLGHQWVFQRFLIEGMANGRRFISAKLEDNKHLDRDEYLQSLSELDPVTRMQLERGDWNIKPAGLFFNRTWFEIIRPEEVPQGMRWIRMWDLAATKNQSSAYTAGALVALFKGKLYIRDMRRVRGDPGEAELLVKQTAMMDGLSVKVYMEREPGSGGVNTIYRYRHSILTGFAFDEYVPKHDKLTRASPLSGLAKAGGVKLVQGDWIGDFLDEYDTFPQGFKDQVDVVSASLQVLSQMPVPNIRRL